MNKENIKTFTFKYDPTASLEKTFTRMEEAARTGQPSIKSHQVSFVNLKDITDEFVSPRPKLFACLVEKRPRSLYQLAKLLKRDYANVYKDVKSLVAMGTIKLEKEGAKIKLVPLYDEIIFDFSVWQKPESVKSIVQIKPFTFLESIRQAIKGKYGIEYLNYDNK